MRTFFSLILFTFLAGSLSAQSSDAKAKQLIDAAEAALGGWDMLYAKNDVSYTYDYTYPATGATDLSTERYIFEGEHSWGRYTQHDINVAPGTEGVVVQSLVSGQPAVNVDGKRTEDPQMVGTAGFLRAANYYWFTMFYKLNDAGSIAKMKPRETIKGVTYDVITVAYDPAVTGKQVNDEYIVYFNPKTQLVDQFYFSLPAMGVNAPVIRMELAYETIDGIPVVTKRNVFQPDANGQYGNSPNLVQTLTDVKFNNGFQPADFRL